MFSSFIFLSALPAAAQTFSPPSESGVEIRETARRILDDPEFRYFPRLDDDGRAQRREWDWQPREPRTRAARSDGWIAAGGLIGGAMQAVVWIALVAIIAAMLVFILRAWLMRDRAAPKAKPPELARIEGEEEPDEAPGEIPADEYLARARRLAGEGRFADAIAHLLLGGMSHLERSGAIRHRRGITFRDYVRAASGDPPRYDGIRTLVRIYEPIGFGRRTATRKHFEIGLASYESGFVGSA